MAHLLFDTLSGVTVDNQAALTVQSLLDSQNLASTTEEIPATTIVATRPPTAITLDEEDVFQCGKCKKQFTSFTLFMCHKKEHAAVEEQEQLVTASSLKQAVQNDLVFSLDDDTVVQNGGTFVEGLQDRDVEVGQPIILSDADILSFNIDNGSVNITSGSHVLSPLSQVIQNSTFLTSSSESGSSLKSLPASSLNVTTLEGQPIILTDASFVTQDDISQQQQGHELNNGTNKIIEFSTSADANFEFVNSTDYTTQSIVTQQPPTTANADILLNTVVEPQPPMKADETTKKDRPPKTSKLKCKYCNKQFTKNFDLQQHLRSHTGEKPFQCVVCGRAFSQKSNVKKHMVTHKVWPLGLTSTLPKEPLQAVAKDIGTNDKEPSISSSPEVEVLVDRAYVCQYCNTRFQSYSELKTHMKEHSHQKVYKCIQKNCQMTFTDLDSFVSHSRRHSTEVLYRCHVCSKQFNTLADLGIHQYTHNAKVPPAKVNSRFYRCIKCKSKFSSPEALDHHMTINTHSYPCQHCGKVFACERYLRRHLPTHGTAQSYTCPQCGKGFRTEQYLNTHKVTHSTHKPFACQHCTAAFNRKDKLVRHLLIHQTVKKYKCPFRVYLGCPKEFNRADKLKLHILTHSSVRPSLTCRTCNKTFQRQSQLRQHDRTYHQPAAHTCEQCGMGFKKKVFLVAHICKPGSEQQKQDAQHRTQPRTLNSARRGSKKTKSRARNKLDLSEVETNIGDNKSGDNVPTIEIIVMPVPVSLEQHSSGDITAGTSGTVEKGSMYHVVFPADSKMQAIYNSTEQTSLNQCSQPQDQEVPVASSTL